MRETFRCGPFACCAGSTEHMTMIAEQAMHSAAGGSSILIVAAKKSGTLAIVQSTCVNAKKSVDFERTS